MFYYSKMTNISSLPEEVLLHILSFLPTSSLISVRRTSTQWRDLSQRPLATRIQSSWSDGDYLPSAAEVHCAALLVTSGYLPEDVMTTLATRIDEFWSRLGYFPSVAEVRCAAALAATGHLTSVEDMKLENLELPSSEDMLSLAGVVNTWVWLNNVTGDIAPLVSSLAFTELRMSNMDLDQATTSGLVLGLQNGVASLNLHDGARLHIQTLMEYDGRGWCGELVCWDNTRDAYQQEVKTWADRINWIVTEQSYCIWIKRK